MNILMLDERTAIVEAAETPMIELMRSLGCEVIPCLFDAVYPFGGSSGPAKLSCTMAIMSASTSAFRAARSFSTKRCDGRGRRCSRRIAAR
jgi:hypothetical protein